MTDSEVKFEFYKKLNDKNIIKNKKFNKRKKI